MKIYIHCIFAILFLYITTNAFSADERKGKTTLTGKITDKQTGLTVPGAGIYFPDIKTAAVSNAEGVYFIDNLPQSRLLIQVSFVGYKTIIETIDLSTTTQKDFALEISVKEINEIVITGHSQAGERNRTPTPISLISKSELTQNTSTNIIDAIAKQPGISQITTGSGISKPVIRGLGYNRVVLVNDGIRQEGQQWGDEHGIEIDEFSVNRIEILKGPASLSYGSDAIAGVINILSQVNVPQGTINGGLIADYQTNNGCMAYSANIAGNMKGMIWNVRYSNKLAHAYHNKYDGYVYNSGYKENTVSGIIGVNKAWGYSHLHFSVYDFIPGLIEGNRDSASGKFTREFVKDDSVIISEIVPEEDLNSYDIRLPFQKILHYKAILNNSFVVKNGSVKTVLGFQQNQRKEFGDVINPDRFGLYFFMNTVNYDLRYILPERNGWDISFGVNGMQQQSQNKGTEFLVPEYSLFDIGGFTIIKKTLGKFDFAGGVRYDSRLQQTKDLYLNAQDEISNANDTGAYQKFTGLSKNFKGISGSLGATYQVNDKLFFKANAAKGYRAPNIAELGSNGQHEGTMRYEIGNAYLKPESSFQLDLSAGINTEHVSAEIDLFSNTISDFIFSRKLNSQSGSDSIRDGAIAFEFVSGKANLNGGEIMIDIHPHPLDWLHFENSFSYVQSEQKGVPDSTRYLPYTPPAKLQSELKADIKKTGKFMSNTFIQFGMETYFEQDKFYSAYQTETATPGYTLLNAGIGTTFVSGTTTLCTVIINANNITDEAYQSHLSRLKYGNINYATGRTGVFNMGRNFNFKLIIPLSFKK
ncbi:MAG: TonB-dependent receptor plug [Bacteroidota bacterium]|jgi:iron complex outermembrane receptor protein|nr:TonB-dependent receptor plug [Bacteroidota bacterium]